MSTDLITVPDVYDCRPPRAGRFGGRFRTHPVWDPATISGYAVTALNWPKPQIKSASRNLVTFNRANYSGGELSRKARRSMSFESPHEVAYYQQLEVDPCIIDIQVQGLQLLYDTNDGPRSYLADAVTLSADGTITAVEIKASGSYFSEPGYRSLMLQVRSDLEAVGIAFKEITREQIEKNGRFRSNVRQLFANRDFAFSGRDLAIARAAADTHAGADMAELSKKLGGDRRVAEAKVKAMTAKRHLAVDMRKPIDSNAIFRLPPPVTDRGIDIRAIDC